LLKIYKISDAVFGKHSLYLTDIVKTQVFKMKSLGDTIKHARTEKGLPLRTVAAYLDIDQAILSKIEHGQRNATREIVMKLAQYFDLNPDDLLALWLSDKLVYEIAYEPVALKALQIAEDKVNYIAFMKTDRDEITKIVIAAISTFKKINKAWVYGSFSRGDDGPKSDIDIALNADDTFSYFDLAEVKYSLEKALNRKVDVGFLDSFKPYILEHVKPDLKLIYER
jgi:predicted nucleotidyltransferase/plasmid maintenance system antidote protein VapI